MAEKENMSLVAEDVEIIRDYFKEIDLARTERHIKDAVLEALGDIRKDDIETDMRITLGKDKSDKGMTFLNCIAVQRKS